ncbi:MAG TPA: AmpG family muropeptide MFS transporter [Desulfobacteraceae bacterium]|nr:AmpG family muropeptide MFS transporter [Desulfobacteraceae bacterium]HPJ68024.1 AmpG family muropeptide MFS transporter [Desulfobacteraceae bacterium]HPQ27923.1 AmpG family muropeptide MFS transporter [Desulfobacteraceae bacterium]
MIRVICSRRMLVSLIMGFSSGLPLLLTISLLQAWMKEEGVDLAVIGIMALVGLPYTIKFLWSPVLDRFTLPFLGRRRGWLLIAQIALVLSISALGATDPGKNPWMVAFAAFLVTFFSASQDIVIDAYRREDLSDEELGLGSSLYINGYRIGMLLASGGGLILADHMPFSCVYLIMAACMLPGIITTILTPEPDTPAGTPRTIKEAAIDPLVEYFTRPSALWILAFILLYKIGDTMASAMTTPFYLDIGFSKTEIGAVVKLFGFWATISGALAGGIIMIRLGINRSLWVFGFLQAVSTACFAVLAKIGYNITALGGVIAFENLSSGMGTAAYAAFMASITNKKFTATQYALLTSLMGIPRVIASAPTGFIAKYLGWEEFFIICTLIAIPGMLLLLKFAPWNTQSAAIKVVSD